MSTAVAEPQAPHVAVESPPTASPPSDEPLFEFVNGEKVELPPMSIYANLITSRFFRILANFLEEHSLGTAVVESMLILDREANLRRRPDVTFVDAERWPLDQEVPETGDWDVIPTLAIEVICTHDLAGTVEAKIIEYFAHGVQAVWVVHSEHHRVYCYSSPTETTILDETATLDGGKLLPGFHVELATLFRRTTAPVTSAPTDSQ